MGSAPSKTPSFVKVAQLVERRSEEPSVVSSNLTLGTERKVIMAKINMDWHNENCTKLGQDFSDYLKILLSVGHRVNKNTVYEDQFLLSCPYCNRPGLLVGNPRIIEDVNDLKIGKLKARGFIIKFSVHGADSYCRHRFDVAIGMSGQNTFVEFIYKGRDSR